ncbi:MAG: response regulator [Candidatus Woesebacteria bacterium]|nr:MAG: response regulator [Candidatus Woesebacteria bacterium]
MAVPLVLIVDDDPAQLMLYSLVLRPLPCYIATAPSGEAALKLLENAHPALLIVDILLPGMSGADVIRTIRKDAQFAPMKIVALTVVPHMLAQEDTALCNVVLAKPIGVAQLKQVIRDLLGV